METRTTSRDRIPARSGECISDWKEDSSSEVSGQVGSADERAAAQDCLFCGIAAGKIPAKLVHEDADIIAFADINPASPVHLLAVPRKHYANVVEAAASDPALIGRLFGVLAKLAEERGLLPGGFRIVCNTGPRGGQTVGHLHFHLLGGRRMTWPPG